MGNKQALTKQDIKLAAFEALIARHEGHVGPRTLLDAARDPGSPFHDEFEWDDGDAAELYRLAQASQLLRRWKGTIIKIDIEAKVVKVEAVRRVQSPESGRKRGADSYQPVESILANPQTRDDMLRTVLRELVAYRKRYAQLVALADIWRAIDDAIDLHDPTHERSPAGDRPQAAA